MLIRVFGMDVVDRQLEGAIESAPASMFALEGDSIGLYTVFHICLNAKLLDILVEVQSFVFVKS
jgi:hypothetical protein